MRGHRTVSARSSPFAALNFSLAGCGRQNGRERRARATRIESKLSCKGQFLARAVRHWLPGFAISRHSGGQPLAAASHEPRPGSARNASADGGRRGTLTRTAMARECRVPSTRLLARRSTFGCRSPWPMGERYFISCRPVSYRAFQNNKQRRLESNVVSETSQKQQSAPSSPPLSGELPISN